MTVARLFDVPPPPTAPELLLALAGQFTLHNDTLALCRPGHVKYPALRAYADSAEHLAEQTAAAIEAVNDLQLYPRANVIDAVVRLKQLAYLSCEAAHLLMSAQDALVVEGPAAGYEADRRDVTPSVDHLVRLARDLTALAAETVIDSTGRIAAEIRSPPANETTAEELEPTHLAALGAIARGHVAVSASQGRQYAHSRDTHVSMAMLRSLEAKGLIAREPSSAPAAYYGGPPRDRVVLTTSGIQALAMVLGQPADAAVRSSLPAVPNTVAPPKHNGSSPSRR